MHHAGDQREVAAAEAGGGGGGMGHRLQGLFWAPVAGSQSQATPDQLEWTCLTY